MWTDSAISIFRHDGFVVVRNLFSSPEAVRMRHDLKHLQEAMSAGGASLARVKGSRFFSGRVGGPLGEIWRDARLLSFAHKIFGPDVALYMNRMMIKDAEYGASVTPHQDFPYFHGSPRKINVFVFLGPCNERNGGLAFAPGTHLFGPIGKRGNLDLEAFGVTRYVTPALEAGDVLFADFLVWHWSWDAIEPIERPMLQIVYQPADDGSYFDETVETPTLASGKWQTERFVPFSTCVTDRNTTPVKNASINPGPFAVRFEA
jgi:hypothetical protein